MKKRIYLSKYKHTTYKNERVLCIDVYFDSETSIIELITKTRREMFFIPASIGFSNSLLDYSADYLICSIQDKPDVNVNK